MKNNDFQYKHPHTVWEIIKSNVEMDIIKGVYKVGDKVPSINEIAKEYNISVNTAGKVLESLREDEIIMKKRGIGYFVLPYSQMKLVKCANSSFDNMINELVEFAIKLGVEQNLLIEKIKEIWEHPHGEDI